MDQDSKEERLNAAKEMLARFREAKRSTDENTKTPTKSLNENQNLSNYFANSNGDQLKSGDPFIDLSSQSDNFNKDSLINHNNEIIEAENPSGIAVTLSDQISGVLSTNLGSIENTSELIEKVQITDLEKRIQELENLVQVQRTNLHKYEGEILSMNSKIQETNTFYESEKQHSNNEFQHLKQELASHKETIGVIINEKTDIEKTLEKQNILLNLKDDKITELSSKLDETTLEMNKVKTDQASYQINNQVSDEIEKSQQEIKKHQSIIDQQSNDLLELKNKLSNREHDNENLRTELASTKSKLEMTEVNLTQLRGASSISDANIQDIEAKTKEISDLNSKIDEFEKREKELSTYIQQSVQDREQIIHQYTTYSKQLTDQIQSLSNKLSEKVQQVETLTVRESELVSHVEQLENQLQNSFKEKPKEKPLVNNEQIDKNELNVLRKKMAELDSKLSYAFQERDSLQEQCDQMAKQMVSYQVLIEEKNVSLSELTTQKEMLQASSPGISSNELVAAAESDKVAASRAMSQNVQLKKQVEELETGLINLTNNKAELLDQIENLKRWKNSVTEGEESYKLEISGLEDSLKERDRTISHLNEQMKHYISFAENSLRTRDSDSESDSEESEEYFNQEFETLKEQLKNAEEQIDSLSSHNLELREQIGFLSTTNNLESSNTPKVLSISEGTQSDIPSVKNNEQNGHEIKETPKPAPSLIESSNTTSQVPILTRDVAMVKLEQKFLDAMNRIADLLAENEQLEHLNIQLQEETEAVGDYITLYQHQRLQVKKKIEEKENQLRNVSLERELLKSKVSQLQGLITKYISPQNVNNISNEVSSNNSADTSNLDNNDASQNLQNNQILFDKNPKNLTEKKSTEQEILSLISEIGANQMLDKNFQPWFWEQEAGRLMDV